MKNSEIADCLASKKKSRTVNPFSVLAQTVREASKSKSGLAANVEHGGGVPNCYAYPADSECVGVVAVRTHGRGGRAYLRYAVIPANKITNSGAAAATLGCRSPWDARMTATTADYADMRETAWRTGDIRWVETTLGGLYYLADGYGWRSARAKSAQITTLPTKRAVRAMQRLCPDGWTVVVTPASQGAAPSPAWRSGGEEYHITAADGRYDVRGTISAAAAAFEARAALRESAALTALIDSGAASDVYCCAADSYRAGNCVAGTQSFAARHALDVSRHYRAEELLAISNGDARFVRAAILAALRREQKEIRQGYALLSEHGK